MGLSECKDCFTQHFNSALTGALYCQWLGAMYQIIYINYKCVLGFDDTLNAHAHNPSWSNETHMHASAAEIRVIPGVCTLKQFINYNIEARKTLMQSICGCHG